MKLEVEGAPVLAAPTAPAAVGIGPRMTDMMAAIPKLDVQTPKKTFLILIAQSEGAGENQAGTLPIAASSVKSDPIEVKEPDAPIAGFLGVPSSLAFDLLSGDLLQSYSGASGIETASLLSFDFGNQDGPVTSTLPPAAPANPQTKIATTRPAMNMPTHNLNVS